MDTLHRADYFESDKAISILPRVPQPDYPEHCHDFHELVMVKSGCGLHYVNGRPYHVSKGSVFYLRAGQVHCFDRSEGLCLTNVVFMPQLLKASSLLDFLPSEPEQTALPLSVGVSAINECEQLFTLIRNECLRRDPCSEAMIEALFSQLVILLWREQRRTLEAVDGDTRLASLIRHINQHLADPIDFAELAEQFDIPPRTLARRMVEVTGLSANNFLGRMRLCQAMRLLANTTDPITDIAFACGFNDSNYFSSRFHQEIGITPSQFRQQKNCYAPHFKIAGTLN